MPRLPTLALAGAFLALSLPIGSQAQEEVVVVGIAAETRTWIGDVTQKLERRLTQGARRSYQDASATGIVQLTFERADNGRPTAIKVLRHSGEGGMRRFAARSVAGLRHIPPIPGGFEREVHVNILMANSQDQLDGLKHRLVGWEAKRFAANPARRRQLALSLTAR